jgi:hypothetical protein
MMSLIELTVVSLAEALVPGRSLTVCPGVPTWTWNVDHKPSFPSQKRLGGTLMGTAKALISVFAIRVRSSDFGEAGSDGSSIATKMGTAAER